MKKNYINQEKALSKIFFHVGKKSHTKVVKMYITCETVLFSHVKVLIQFLIFW